MKRLALIIPLILFLHACGDPASRQHQKELVRQATGLFSQCRFEETTAASDRAITLKMADPGAYTFALMLKARSLEQLHRAPEAEQIYQQLVELAGDVNNVEQARKVTHTLDVMMEDCAGAATTSGQEAPPATSPPRVPPG